MLFRPIALSAALVLMAGAAFAQNNATNSDGVANGSPNSNMAGAAISDGNNSATAKAKKPHHRARRTPGVKGGNNPAASAPAAGNYNATPQDSGAPRH